VDRRNRSRTRSRDAAAVALPLLVAIGVITAMLVITHRVPFARVWIFLLPLFHRGGVRSRALRA
jgi:hypothetical protein